MATPDERAKHEDVAAVRLPCLHRSSPRLAAVVLNYRTPDDSVLAVSSLLASNRPPDQVIVVDNDVREDCRPHLARFRQLVTYLPTGRNLGFSGGMNVGVRAAFDAGAERVLLANSDALVAPDCVGLLEEALEPGGDGIVGPLVLSRSSPNLVASAGVDYSRRTGRMRHRGAGRSVADRSWASGERDAVSGCLMLISRSVFDRIGFLDERYFFSFEEIDFCLRAREAGFPIRFVADANAYHEGGASIGPTSVRRLYFAARNHMLMANTHGAKDDGFTRGFRTVTVGALNLAHALRAPGSSVVGRLGATARGIRDHLRGRYGADVAM